MLHIEFMKFCQNHWSLVCSQESRPLESLSKARSTVGFKSGSCPQAKGRFQLPRHPLCLPQSQDIALLVYFATSLPLFGFLVVFGGFTKSMSNIQYCVHTFWIWGFMVVFKFYYRIPVMIQFRSTVFSTLFIYFSSFLAPNGTRLSACAISRGPKTLDFQLQHPAPHLPT